MTIIKSNKIVDKRSISALIDSEVLQEIKAYCEWAGIYDLGFFIEDVSSYIFAKDKEWQEKQAYKVKKKEKVE